jgi:hypothetical protein
MSAQIVIWGRNRSPVIVVFIAVMDQSSVHRYNKKRIAAVKIEGSQRSSILYNF